MRLATRLLALAAILLAALALPAVAQAAGTPNISLNAAVPGDVLLGGEATVELTASNPAAQPYGYNLSFRDVLPRGVDYVPGTSTYGGGPTADPQVIVDAGGVTTLVWLNVADLSPNSTGTLGYTVKHDTTGPDAYTVAGARSTYSHQPSAYIHTDERSIPDFDGSGAYVAGSATGTATDTTDVTTRLTAIDVTIAEGSPEGELLRGAHDHQTTFTLNIVNNGVAPTDPLTVTAYLPAGLEFLGCGAADNTTDAPTNDDPGGEEWPGSGSLAGGNVGELTAADCPAPASVATVTTVTR